MPRQWTRGEWEEQAGRKEVEWLSTPMALGREKSRVTIIARDRNRSGRYDDCNLCGRKPKPQPSSLLAMSNPFRYNVPRNELEGDETFEYDLNFPISPTLGPVIQTVQSFDPYDDVEELLNEIGGYMRSIELVH